MNTHRAWIVAAVLLCGSLWTGAAWADIIPSYEKSSTTPSSTTIDPFISSQVKNLATPQATEQKLARTNLSYECEGHNGVVASQQYQSAYAKSLNDALLPLVSEKSPIRVRLNAAVTAEQVASKVYHSGASDQFLPLTAKLLKDKETAIVVVGVKMSRYVLGALAQNNGRASDLAKLLLDATEAHGDLAAVIEDSYSALTLEPFQADNQNIATMATPLLPALNSLIEWRADQYRKGAAVAAPAAERKITAYLSVTVFPAVTSNSSLRDGTLKALGDLTCNLMAAINNGNTNDDLVIVTRELGSALDVMGDNLQNKDLSNVGKSINGLPLTPQGQVLETDCDQLVKALGSMGVTIVPPPKQ